MGNSRESIVDSLLNDPRIFNPFSQFFGDQSVVIEVIKNELNLSGKDSVLDIGCGTGNLSRMFTSKNYIGVDFDEKYIDFARRNYNRNFMVMDASALKFEDNSFDLVFTKDIYHHLDDSVFLKVLAEIKRVLKPGGTGLIIEISYRLSDDMLYKKILRGLDRGRYIREFNVLKKHIEGYFNTRKAYMKNGMWGDLSVFLITK